MISAGVGTGKTETLMTKYAFIIASGVSPKNILGITFTNKAASEMIERTKKKLGFSPEEKLKEWIGTFHSIALRILRFKNTCEIIGLK